MTYRPEEYLIYRFNFCAQGLVMPRRNTAERRVEIVDALLRVMADQGWAKATIARIAREAGLTPGLLHYHFQSKQEILLELVHRIESEHEARIRRLSAQATTPTQRVQAMVLAYLKAGDEVDASAVASWVTIVAEAIRQPEVRDAFSDAILRLTAPMRVAIQDGLDTGEFHTNGLDAEACAAAVMACVQGYYNLGVAARATVPRGSAAPACLRMVGGLIGIRDVDAFSTF